MGGHYELHRPVLLLSDGFYVPSKVILEVWMKMGLGFFNSHKAETNISVVSGRACASKLRHHQREIKEIVSAQTVAGDIYRLLAIYHADLLEQFRCVGRRKPKIYQIRAPVTLQGDTIEQFTNVVFQLLQAGICLDTLIQVQESLFEISVFSIRTLSQHAIKKTLLAPSHKLLPGVP